MYFVLIVAKTIALVSDWLTNLTIWKPFALYEFAEFYSLIAFELVCNYFAVVFKLMSLKESP